MHRIVLYTLIVLLTVFEIYAQQDSIVLSEPVIIIGHKDHVAPTLNDEHTMKKELIESLPANDIGEVASYLPGVYLNDYGGIGGLRTISAKGLNSNYTQVFLNGVPLRNGVGNSVNLSRVNSNNLSSIAFGHSSSTPTRPSQLLQPFKLSLNIDLDNKDALTLQSKVGGFGLQQHGISTTYNINANHTIFASGNIAHSNGNYNYRSTFDGSEQKRIRNEARRINGLIIYKIDFSDSSSIKVLSQNEKSNTELPGAVILYYQTPLTYLDQNSSNNSIQYKRGRLKSVLTFNLDHSYFSTYYKDPNYLGTEILMNSYFQNTVSPSISYLYQLNRNTKLDLGVETNHLKLSGDETAYRNKLILSSGGELKLNKLNIKAHTVYQYVNENTDTDIANFLGWDLTLNYFPTTNSPFKLYFNNGKYVRLPNFQELYFQRVTSVIQAEQLHTYQLGINYLKQNKKTSIYANGNFFLNDVNNKITSLPTQNLFIWSTQNLGEVRTYGIEPSFQLDYRIDSVTRITSQCSYTFQTVKDLTDKSSREYNNQIAYTPFELFKSQLAIQYKSISLSWSNQFNGLRYSLGDNNDNSLMPSWWIHNFSMNFNFQWNKTKASMTLGANNLFDSAYEIIRSFPMPGRYYTISLKVNVHE